MQIRQYFNKCSLQAGMMLNSRGYNAPSEKHTLFGSYDVGRGLRQPRRYTVPHVYLALRHSDIKLAQHKTSSDYLNHGDVILLTPITTSVVLEGA